MNRKQGREEREKEVLEVNMNRRQGEKKGGTYRQGRREGGTYGEKGKEHYL